jgi:HPt (histidine-containing phosphotransfer) domain-containing protein
MSDSNDRVIVKVDPDLKDLIPSFMQSIEVELSYIESSVEKGEFDEVKRLAQGIKGSGGGYGFHEVTKLGADIEEAAAKQDVDTIAAKVHSIRVHLAFAQVVYE